MFGSPGIPAPGSEQVSSCGIIANFSKTGHEQMQQKPVPGLTPVRQKDHNYIAHTSSEQKGPAMQNARALKAKP